jgi:YD repeat-containing protein
VIRDEQFIPLQYNYDANGNPTSTVHADGSAERFSFDAVGNIARSVNRRGQAIIYTNDARPVGPQGSRRRLDRDLHLHDRGNLLTATDQGGTTAFAYDGADRLTNATSPNGRSLQYTYDAGGRRTRMEDHDGFAVNYTYDSLGRMERLTDGSGALLESYSYDVVGRLARDDNGNGTFTTYTYDAAGQLTSLVNHAPDGSVNSRFDYTYDALGRRTSVNTLEGVTTFGYDALAQLNSVTLPGGAHHPVRIRRGRQPVAVVDGGVRTDYTTNDLNQYTQVGSSA